MTLVEVVGALALLATLLVGVLLAKARFAHQLAAADRRLAAVAAADRMLTVWHQDERAFPRVGTGTVPGAGGMSWRTQLVDNGAVSDLGANVVRLDIIDDRGEAAAGPMLASVEVVMPKETDRTTPAPTPGPTARDAQNAKRRPLKRPPETIKH